jgi:hypothetical protein
LCRVGLSLEILISLYFIEKSPNLDCTLQDFNGQLNNDIISEAEKINGNAMQINETDIESQNVNSVNNKEI